MATKTNRGQKKKSDKVAAVKSTAPKPSAVPSDLEEFQRAYGDEWLRILQMPAFRAGMQLLNIQQLDKLTNFSEEQIEKYAVPILSMLIGQLKHENELCNLHLAKTKKFPWEEEEEYFPPEHVAQIEELKKNLRQQQEKDHYA